MDGEVVLAEAQLLCWTRLRSWGRGLGCCWSLLSSSVPASVSWPRPSSDTWIGLFRWLVSMKWMVFTLYRNLYVYQLPRFRCHWTCDCPSSLPRQSLCHCTARWETDACSGAIIDSVVFLMTIGIHIMLFNQLKMSTIFNSCIGHLPQLNIYIHNNTI